MSSEVSRMDRLATGMSPVNPIADVETFWSVDERLQHHHCPGMAVCVIEDGKVGEARGFGVCEVGGAPVEADTIFSGASISKPLTAVLAMQLVEQGAVDLDAPINQRLKRWRIPENDFTRAAPVTLRHLLSHRAGTTVPGFGNFPIDRPAPTLIDILSGRDPSLTPAVEVDKIPGGTVRYSGGGTQVVQLLLEDVTGLPFADLARERIFEPLEMARTTFELPLSDAWRAMAAVGHGATGEALASRYNFTPQLAAGGVYTTVLDYARFMVECRGAWLGEPNRLMNQDTARAMMTRQGGGQFGLGWEVIGEGDATRFSHGGSNEGYQCISSCLLSSGQGAVVLTNGMMGLLLHAEALTSLAMIYEWPGYLATPKRICPVPVERHDIYTGRYDVISGIASAQMDIWSQDGQLHAHTQGLIFPPRPIYLGENGRFFSQQSRSETAVIYGENGQAQTLIVYAEGDVELIRAVRRPEPVG